MKAFVVDQPQHYGLQTLECPAPGPGEVLLRVAHCGICGSDMDVLEGTRPASVTRYPAVLGHEFSGTIEELGAGVTGLTRGMPAAIDTLIRCHRCFNCQQGWVCHCERGYAQTGFTHPGGMAEYVVVRQEQIYPVQPESDLRLIAFAEPSSCAAHGVVKAELKPGDNVVILGAGPIGALALRIAALYSPGSLILVETDPLKLALAERLGATHAFNASDPELQARIREATGGRGADAIIECAGSTRALNAMWSMAGTKARLVMIGIPGDMHPPLDFLAMLTHDLTFRVSNGYTTQVWTWVLNLLQNGALDPLPLRTHAKPLSAALDAFQLLRERREPVIKAMLDCES